MHIQFYGVRGSIPAPGQQSVRYGGNTACVLVRNDAGEQLILDAGTGIRQLGTELLTDPRPITLLLSHNHWDHIQGFPFFRPAYQRDREIHIFPGLTTPHEPYAILNQLKGSVFPVPATALAARIQIENTPTSHAWILQGFHIQRCPLNHPGGGSAYLIEADGQRFAYVTDNELNPPNTPVTSFEKWCEFVHGVDLLLHDAQYVPRDMPMKHGWGHSLVSEAVALAQAAAVKHLVLFSYDPERSDDELDAIAAGLATQALPFPVSFAREGMCLSCA
ncbi:MBL fold metallo-hydrolase [Pokkaliibacter sp. MBI-7]|uniref:MBL fold metallo-hydrolase n=1 Tax=Pokkaliibacter sp. MBI-7 TaxID=3040600 RepID=UPI0024496519|nr:MBL fold metallo-hydrolase [Pokkaliibacter sp. MBI-7]MDH2434190.1 MBL fold metallo-hydrolase [Pokkaliibacter sp. MBI-7]